MITFGLTGGIACGKSTVTKTFRANDIPIVDADIVARQVVLPGTFGYSQIVKYFGSEYLEPTKVENYHADMTPPLDRVKLGALAFSTPSAMKILNSIMLPLIQTESAKQLKSFHDMGHRVVGYDAALIIEMGNVDKYYPLIVVSCPTEMQVSRLMKRNGLTNDEAMLRINAQMPLYEKVKLAQYVIDTSGTMEYSEQQTLEIITKLKKL